MTESKQSYAVVLDIGGTNLRAARISESGEINARFQTQTGAEGGARTMIPAINDFISKCRSDSEGRCIAIGVGFPGFFHSKAARIIQSPNLPGWENFDLKGCLQDTFQIPVYLENDANAAALGEYHYGHGKTVDHFCHLTLGTGLGCGLILYGEIFRGGQGFGSEFGHTPLALKEDYLCGCGNRGCLETILSKTGFSNLVGTAWAKGDGTDTELFQKADGNPDNIDIAQAAVMARDGCSFTREIFSSLGESLGIALAVLLNTIDLEMVTLGGGLSMASDLFLGKARDIFQRHAVAGPASRVRLLPSKLGDDAGLLGAASLCFLSQ